MVGIAGESGCGKSTLASTVLRLQPKDAVVEGEVLVAGRDVLTMGWGDLRALRWAEASIVFQGALHSLNPVRRIETQIAEPIRLHEPGLSEAEVAARVGELLEQVGLPAARSRVYPHQLSGGQRQRVMIAMALACRPQLIVADEPTTALDVMVQAQILDLISGLVKDLGRRAADHQPRPVGARRRLRPGRGDVRRPGRRVRLGGRRSSPPRPTRTRRRCRAPSRGSATPRPATRRRGSRATRPTRTTCRRAARSRRAARG